MGKMKRPRHIFAMAAAVVVVLSLAAASEAAPRRKSSRKLSSGNDLNGVAQDGSDGAAAEDLIPIPDHYLLRDDQADDDDDDFEDYEDEAEEEDGEDDRVGKKR